MEPYRTDEQSRLEQLSGEDWLRWYESLAFLDRRPRAAAARAFGWIWLRCRAKVTEGFRFYLPDLAARFGKKIETAQGWLNELQKMELVHVRNRTIQARVPEGWVTADVYHPNPELRNDPLRVDPQRWLPGWEMDEPGAPPIVAPCSFVNIPGKFPESSRKVPGTFRENPGKFPQRPSEDAIREAMGSGQMLMGQGLRLLLGRQESPRGPPPQRVKRVAAPDIRYQKSETRNFDIDIGKCGQKAFENQICRELGDPDLEAVPLRKVAEKLAEGELDWKDVQRVIDNARQTFRKGKVPAAWIYFVGAMRKLFEEHGWRWRRKRNHG